MNRRNLLAAISTTALGFLALNTSALAQTAADAVSNDPFLWLEEVEGEKALSWVRGQNARSLPKLTQDPRYAKLEEDALNIIRAKDKATCGSGFCACEETPAIDSGLQPSAFFQHPNTTLREKT